MTLQFPVSLSPERPVLIAGPTASGKSALALEIATGSGRRIVNADALQVFDGWRLLTARPSAEDEQEVRHSLYGHVSYKSPYSVGHWLRDVAPFLTERPAPVLVGGTGLYFSALTEGLADIPATLPDIRQRADDLLANHGIAVLITDLDDETRRRIDLKNPVRVQRAWEVQTQTGRGIASWQDQTGPPLLPPDRATLLHVSAEKSWLNSRIDARFERMLADGALDEARRMAQDWDAARLSSRAIGAAQLVAVVRGDMSESAAVAAAKIATHQYAKRQRTWFRRRMQHWHLIDAATTCGNIGLRSKKTKI